jgi:hypothetical protein
MSSRLAPTHALSCLALIDEADRLPQLKRRSFGVATCEDVHSAQGLVWTCFCLLRGTLTKCLHMPRAVVLCNLELAYIRSILARLWTPSKNATDGLRAVEVRLQVVLPGYTHRLKIKMDH